MSPQLLLATQKTKHSKLNNASIQTFDIGESLWPQKPNPNPVAKLGKNQFCVCPLRGCLFCICLFVLLMVCPRIQKEAKTTTKGRKKTEQWSRWCRCHSNSFLLGVRKLVFNREPRDTQHPIFPVIDVSRTNSDAVETCDKWRQESKVRTVTDEILVFVVFDTADWIHFDLCRFAVREQWKALQLLPRLRG